LQWKRINDVDGLSATVTALTNELNAVKIQVGANTTAIGVNANAIATEKSRAEAAEQANATAIATEKSRAEAAEQANATAIATEKSRAEDVEAAHAIQIEANATAIATEKSRAEAAEATLQTNIDSLSTDINNKMQVANAMTFKGVLDGSTLTQLPSTDVQAGDTYKVGVAGKYLNSTDTQYIGDLIIAKADQGEETSYNGGWWHISSGYEDDYAAKLHAVFDSNSLVTTTIGLAGGANENRGRVTFESNNDNLQISASGTNGTNGVSTDLKLSFNLVWGTFDD
jgi:hypothetical protein